MKKFNIFILVLSCLTSKAQLTQNQVLNLPLNGNFTDEKAGHVVTPTNLSFGPDRHGNATGAAYFGGWCSGNPSSLKVSNATDLQFTTGFTISFWAKVDLSQGMDPADGSCSSSGHHMLWAKGGDGYGTSPNGIFAKLSQFSDNIIGCSPGTGNLNQFTQVSNAGSWHMYTYVITSTTYDFYLDGVNIQSTTHSINFNEINAEDLHLGILGPKSTPALGITNWFPMTGAMDDVMVFDKALDEHEVASLSLDLEVPESTPPAISRVERLGITNYFCGARESGWIYKSFILGDHNLLVGTSYSTYNGGSPRTITIDKVINDSLIRVLNTSEAYYQAPAEDKNFLHINNIYLSLLGDSLFIFDTNFSHLESRKMAYSDYTGLFSFDNYILLATQNKIEVLDLGLNKLNEYQLANGIREIHTQGTQLIVSNVNEFYIFNSDLSSYNTVVIPSINTFQRQDSLTLTNNNGTQIFDISTLNLLKSNALKLSTAVTFDNEVFYWRINSDSTILVFDQNLALTNTINLPLKSHPYYISCQNGFFIQTQYISINSPQITKYLINKTGQIIYVAKANTNGGLFYSPNDQIKKLNNGDYLFSTQGSISKLGISWNLKWIKEIPIGFGNIIVNSDDSFWISMSGKIVRFNNDENKCDFEALNPFSNSYCPSTNEKLHSVEPKFSSNTTSSFQFQSGCMTGAINKLFSGLDITFHWQKDGIVFSEDYFGQFMGNGNYTVFISQGSSNCAKQSPLKYVSYSTINNPNSPLLSSENEKICVGQSTSLTGSCVSGSQVRWV